MWESEKHHFAGKISNEKAGVCIEFTINENEMKTYL